jgi:hypothetical protein
MPEKAPRLNVGNFHKHKGLLAYQPIEVISLESMMVRVSTRRQSAVQAEKA